jgi:hypothetical protein
MRAISPDDWSVAGNFVYKSKVFQFIFDKPRGIPENYSSIVFNPSNLL